VEEPSTASEAEAVIHLTARALRCGDYNRFFNEAGLEMSILVAGVTTHCLEAVAVGAAREAKKSPAASFRRIIRRRV
jgi:hypothetical protein